MLFNEICIVKGIILYDEFVDWVVVGDYVNFILVGMDIIKINVGCIFCGFKEFIKVCICFRV